jgi:translation machinery-associated protein 16
LKRARAVDFFGFFYHALPQEDVLPLPDLHAIIREVWLARHDPEIAEEQAARRKGRPKSVKQQKLEELKLRETDEYRTGMGASRA